LKSDQNQIISKIPILLVIEKKNCKTIICWKL